MIAWAFRGKEASKTCQRVWPARQIRTPPLFPLFGGSYLAVSELLYTRLHANHLLSELAADHCSQLTDQPAGRGPWPGSGKESCTRSHTLRIIQRLCCISACLVALLASSSCATRSLSQPQIMPDPGPAISWRWPFLSGACLGQWRR